MHNCDFPSRMFCDRFTQIHFCFRYLLKNAFSINKYHQQMSAFLQLVEKKFNEAKESKDLISFDTTEVKKESNGVDVRLYNLLFDVFY